MRLKIQVDDNRRYSAWSLWDDPARRVGLIANSPRVYATPAECRLAMREFADAVRVAVEEFLDAEATR